MLQKEEVEECDDDALSLFKGNPVLGFALFCFLAIHFYKKPKTAAVIRTLYRVVGQCCVNVVAAEGSCQQWKTSCRQREVNLGKARKCLHSNNNTNFVSGS